MIHLIYPNAGVDSSSSKSSVPGGKHRPNETDSPLYSDAALDITLHTTTTPVVSRDWLYNPGELDRTM